MRNLFASETHEYYVKNCCTSPMGMNPCCNGNCIIPNLKGVYEQEV